MIGIVDPKLWNLGVGLLSKWNGPYFLFFYYVLSWILFYLRIVRPSTSLFFLRNSSSSRLGQNSRASTSISSIAKMRSSLICFMFARVAYRENQWLHLWCTASTSENS